LRLRVPGLGRLTEEVPGLGVVVFVEVVLVVVVVVALVLALTGVVGQTRCRSSGTPGHPVGPSGDRRPEVVVLGFLSRGHGRLGFVLLSRAELVPVRAGDPRQGGDPPRLHRVRRTGVLGKFLVRIGVVAAERVQIGPVGSPLVGFLIRLYGTAVRWEPSAHE
jgi:hypothetical protein